MPKLNDTQTILLSTASQREDLSLHPLPDPHAKAGARVAKAIATLLSGGLLQERETSATDEIARTEGDISYGLYVTPVGLAAIGVEPGRRRRGAPARARARAHQQGGNRASPTTARGGRNAGRAGGRHRLAAAHDPRCADRPAQEGPRDRQDQTRRCHLLSHSDGWLMAAPATGLEHQLASLERMSTRELQDQWRRLTASPLPRVSPALLRLALAWEIQAKALGGLSRETTRTLDQLTTGKSRTLAARAGTRLVREWGGKAHVVTVGEDDIIRWDGREWRSLSEVARAITGTRWSGPAFFGLKTKTKAAAA